MSDSEAVKIWRDRFRLNCSRGRKHDIDMTVMDLDLWKYVLDNWGYWMRGKWKPFNPFAVGHQLSEYERLERQGKTDTYSVVQEAAYARYRKERDRQIATWQD